MPFEFENTTDPRPLEVVPALKLTLPPAAATEAVTVCPLTPKLTPFELENTT